MTFFDVNVIAFSFLGYSVSYLELLATILGLISVWFATRENILTWPFGILNEFALFYLFFQVSLYAGMLLQVIFFIVTLIGWYNWRQGKSAKSIRQLNQIACMGIIFFSLILAWLFNLLIARLHIFLPTIITMPAAQSLIDSWVAVTSILAVVLLAKKYVFSWVLWILVDIVSTYLFWNQQLYLVAIEYVIFLMMATYGYGNWRKIINERNALEI